MEAEKNRAGGITEPEATELYGGELVSEQAAKNRQLLERLFGWQIPVDTPPSIVESFLGNSTVWADRLTRETHNPVPQDRTIQGQIEVYLETQATKVRAAKLTAKRYDNVKYMFKIIQEQLGPSKPVATISEKDFTDFHGFLMKKLVERHKDPQGKAGYCDDYGRGILSRFKAFVKHLHVSRLLDHLPRNFDTLSIEVDEKPKQKMTDDEIKAILNGVTSTTNQMRLHVLLMLNCGYRAMDIATLRVGEIRDGRIIRKRHKTKDEKNTPTVNYKLWNETRSLLDRWVVGKEDKDIALRTKSGGLWAYSTLDEHDEGLPGTKQTDNVATNYNRKVQEGLGIRKPYSLLRKTASSKLDEHGEFGRYAEHFLGERPSSVTSKNYVTPSQDRFDAAVSWLGEQFGIK